MKRLYISAILLFSLLTTGCQSVFDLDNDGRLTREQIFSDYTLTKAYLNKCYILMPNYNGIRYNSNFLEAYTDDAYDSNDVKNGNPYKYYTGLLTSSNHALIDNLYSQSWETIRKCNVFLENIDDATNMTIESDRNKWKGEALTMRAYVYWNLVKRYGSMPVLKQELAIEHDYSKDIRPSFYECVKAILEDCDEAIAQPDLPWRLSVGSDRGYMHKALAVAIKSEAILYAASPQWDPEKQHAAEAARITRECLDLLKEHGYALYNPTVDKNSLAAFSNYQRYFLLEPEMSETPTDKETIFADRTGRVGEVWKSHGFPTSAMANTDKAGNCPTQELVDAYETSDGIPVLNLSVPYADEAHLIPDYNPENKTYNPEKPYENRDPRFYSTVFHDGSLRNLKTEKEEIRTYIGEDASVPNGNAAISATSERNTRTGYYLRKYVHFESAKNNNKDGYFRIFRLAEMYLNYAEAEFYANGVTRSAVDAINEIRARVDMLPISYSISRTDFEKRLRNERRVELAYEDHRFYDVRRWKILNETEKTATGMQITKMKDGSLAYKRIQIRNTPDMAADKYLIRPVPFEQQNIYKQYGVEFQNPGW